MNLDVFLIEDELPTRKGIRENVQWDILNLNYVGEARNGEEALPLILELQPHIIISDIKMPRMDGIELSKKVKEFLPNTKIIFISAYDEFELAQEAIEIGVSRYVLKPITPKKIIDALQKVTVIFENEMLEYNDMVNGEVDNQIDTLQFKDILEDVNSAQHVIAIIIEENIDNKVLQNTKLFSSDVNVRFFSGTPSGCLVFGENSEDCMERAYLWAYSLKQDNPGNYGTIALGTVGFGIDGAEDSYRNAQKTLQHRHLLGNHLIISYHELEAFAKENEKLINSDRERFVDFLVSGAEHECETFLKKYLQAPKSIYLSMKNYLTYMAIDVLNNIASFIAENIGEPNDYINDLKYPDNIIEECTSVQQAVKILTPILCDTLALREQIKKPYYEIMKKALREIEKRFSDPDFTLPELASSCGMSPAHFGTVFKQTHNLSFIKYLTNFRLGKAKTLLHTTNLLTSEIAYKIGYKDAHYFSFVFKKNVGVTPTEYKAVHTNN